MHGTSNPLLSFVQAQAIALALGPDWQAITKDEADFTRHERAELHYRGDDPDLQGAYLYCDVDRYGRKGLWHWGGSSTDRTLSSFIPSRGDTYTAYHTGVNVTGTKPLPQMARDLKRRLLPAFLRGYATVRQLQREANAQRDQDNALAQDVSQALPGSRYTPKGESVNGMYSDEARVDSRGPLYLHLRVSYGSVRVEHFSMTPQQAREFVALVATWQSPSQ